MITSKINNNSLIRDRKENHVMFNFKSLILNDDIVNNKYKGNTEFAIINFKEIDLFNINELNEVCVYLKELYKVSYDYKRAAGPRILEILYNYFCNREFRPDAFSERKEIQSQFMVYYKLYKRLFLNKEKVDKQWFLETFCSYLFTRIEPYYLMKGDISKVLYHMVDMLLFAFPLKFDLRDHIHFEYFVDYVYGGYNKYLGSDGVADIFVIRELLGLNFVKKVEFRDNELTLMCSVLTQIIWFYEFSGILFKDLNFSNYIIGKKYRGVLALAKPTMNIAPFKLYIDSTNNYMLKPYYDKIRYSFIYGDSIIKNDVTALDPIFNETPEDLLLSEQQEVSIVGSIEPTEKPSETLLVEKKTKTLKKPIKKKNYLFKFGQETKINSALRDLLSWLVLDLLEYHPSLDGHYDDNLLIYNRFILGQDFKSRGFNQLVGKYNKTNYNNSIDDIIDFMSKYKKIVSTPLVEVPLAENKHGKKQD